MATATKFRTVGEFKLASVTWLKQFKIGFVVTVVAIVIALVAPVAHFNRVVLFGNDDFVVLVVLNRQRLSFLVARIAVKTGNIFLQSDKVSI